MAEPMELDLKTTLDLMRGVDAARIEGQAVEEYVFFDRSAVKGQLKRVMEAQGSHPTDRDLDSAIAAWEDAQNRFVQPSHSFANTLSSLYISRGIIAKRFGIPLLVIALMGSIAFGAIQGTSSLRLRSAERGVENRIEQLYRQDEQLGEQAINLMNSPVRRELTAQQDHDLVAKINSANQRLSSTDSFFGQFAPDGHADDSVNRKNYGLASAHAGSVEQQINLASEDVASAAKLIQSRQQLLQLSTDAAKLYASIKAIAKEPEAVSKADSLYAEAQNYAAAGHITNFTSAIGRLSDLEVALQQEYRLVITGGDTRCRDDAKYNKSENIRRCERGLNPKNFYVFVDSVSTNGKLVRVNVTDEELGSTLKITHWAERVPEEVYRSVESDYKDNGLFDRKELGVKQRGFLTARLQYDGKELQQIGQITRKGN